MSSGDYEYGRLLASSWDFIRGDTSAFPDRQFYHDLIDSNGEPVLVVGLRNYTLEQIINLLRNAGFSEIQAFADFSKEPATDEDGKTSILSKKQDAAGALT